VGDGSTCSPDTVTCPEKKCRPVAEDRTGAGCAAADELDRSATPSPSLIFINFIFLTFSLNGTLILLQEINLITSSDDKDRKSSCSTTSLEKNK
jgi:hypothetical protein